MILYLSICCEQTLGRDIMKRKTYYLSNPGANQRAEKSTRVPMKTQVETETDNDNDNVVAVAE